MSAQEQGKLKEIENKIQQWKLEEQANIQSYIESKQIEFNSQVAALKQKLTNAGASWSADSVLKEIFKEQKLDSKEFLENLASSLEKLDQIINQNQSMNSDSTQQIKNDVVKVKALLIPRVQHALTAAYINEPSIDADKKLEQIKLLEKINVLVKDIGGLDGEISEKLSTLKEGLTDTQATGLGKLQNFLKENDKKIESKSDWDKVKNEYNKYAGSTNEIDSVMQNLIEIGALVQTREDKRTELNECETQLNGNISSRLEINCIDTITKCMRDGLTGILITGKYDQGDANKLMTGVIESHKFNEAKAKHSASTEDLSSTNADVHHTANPGSDTMKQQQDARHEQGQERAPAP